MTWTIESARKIIDEASDVSIKLQHLLQYLKSEGPDYHWVGFYFLVDGRLQLGPFVGPETEHRTIFVGQGVCGTAVKENRTVVVDDVSTLDNYLACNLDTKSELVVLIRDPENQGIVAQLDIDSTRPGGFDAAHVAKVEHLCSILAPAVRDYARSQSVSTVS